MKKPIFVLLPGIKGEHLIRVDRIVNIVMSEVESRKSTINIEREGKSYELYSYATVGELNRIIQLELSSIKNL